MSAAFAKSGFQWRCLSAYSVELEQILSDDSVEAILVIGIDLAPKKIRRVVQQMLGLPPSRKMVWATVTVLDEDDFDTETDNVPKVEGFNVVVDVPQRISDSVPRGCNGR